MTEAGAEAGDSIFRCLYADTQKELTAKLRKNIDIYQGVDLAERSRMTLTEWVEQLKSSLNKTVSTHSRLSIRFVLYACIPPAIRL